MAMFKKNQDGTLDLKYKFLVRCQMGNGDFLRSYFLSVL